MNYFFSTLLVISIVSNTIGQDIFDPDNYNFECYSEVLMPTHNTIYVYTGDDHEVETREQTIKIITGESKWVKKKADRNCLSSNPDDCLVWCLVDQTENKTFTTVIDTSTTKQWNSYRYKSRANKSKMSATVLCKQQISKDLLSALAKRLYNLGYDTDPNKEYKKLKGCLKKEFNTFQEDYELPIGKWTKETMLFLFKSKKANKE